MQPLGATRYLAFRVFNPTAVLGLTISGIAFAFIRNGALCSDPVTLVEVGQGYYSLVYTPSTAGNDYFAVAYAPVGLLFENHETIVDLVNTFSNNAIVTVTQNTGGTNALVPTITNPSSYTLYVYKSSDWLSGNTDTSQAVDSTALDSSGNWVNPAMSLLHGTYHFVLRNNAGAVVVFRANVVI